jgi:Na+/melibiose symporter-like transporter
MTGIQTPAFRWLLGAGAASLVGDGVRVAALPLFTAVVTGNALAVSAVATAELLPWLLIALPAGALVDRWRPRRVVITAHLVRAVAGGLLTGAVLAHAATVPLLVVIAFVVTSGETFADSAYQTLLVELAGRSDLNRANSRYVTAETLGLDLAGPLLAAATFAWQPAACFGLDAVSFIVAAIFVTRVPDVSPARQRARPAEAGVDRTGSSLAGQVLDGGRFLLRQRALRTLVLAVMAAALAVAGANAVVSLYAVQSLAIRPALVPTLWVAQAIGTLVAARLVARLVSWLGEGPVMVGALFLLGGGFLVVGAVPAMGAAWAAYGVVGLGAGAWNVLSSSRRQRLTPDGLIGRVTSAYRILAWGLMPLGAALAGPLAAASSLATVFLVAGGMVLVAAIVLCRPLARMPAPA